MPWTPPPLEAPPDPALTAAFTGCLPGGQVAGPLLAFRSLSSTQTLCRTLAEAGAPEGLVVLADHQTAGRGRRGRAWFAPPGAGLLFSCLLRPPLVPERWPELMLAAGCAVAEALEATAGVLTRLRWPNDVLAGDRKLAGILAEGVSGKAAFVVLGIGINVRQMPAEWPEELARRAVSLAELGHTVSREALLGPLLARLAGRYAELLADGLGPVREAWRARAAFGGRVETRGVTGLAVDLAADGALVVEADDGATFAVAAGEVAAGGLAREEAE